MYYIGTLDSYSSIAASKTARSATAPSATIAMAPSITRVPIVSLTAVAPSDSKTSDFDLPTSFDSS